MAARIAWRVATPSTRVATLRITSTARSTEASRCSPAIRPAMPCAISGERRSLAGVEMARTTHPRRQGNGERGLPWSRRGPRYRPSAWRLQVGHPVAVALPSRSCETRPGVGVPAWPLGSAIGRALGSGVLSAGVGIPIEWRRIAETCTGFSTERATCPSGR
jgi:hypothetical protein